MTTLDMKIRAQKNMGIKSNKENVDLLYNLMIGWYNEISTPALQPSDPRANIMTPEGRQFALGAVLGKIRHWVCDSNGNLAMNYPRLVLSYAALFNIGKVIVDDEARIILSLMRLSFMQDYGLYLQKLKNNPELLIVPIFADNEGILDGINPIFDRYIMSYITKPEGTGRVYTVSYTDEIFNSFWEDIYGLKPDARDEKLKRNIAKLKEKHPRMNTNPEHVYRLLEGVPLKYEYRLIQNVLRGDYAFCTKFAFTTIDKYKRGELYAFRKSTRGRKPKTVDLFAERMYPRLSSVLNSRLEKILAFEEKNKLGIIVNYVSPYFFSFYVPYGSISQAKPLVRDVHSTAISSLTPRSISNGDLL